MRVTIEHSQKTTGLVFRKTHHLVHTTVEFSSEEMRVIEERKLFATVVMERSPGSDSGEYGQAQYLDVYDMRIGTLTRGTDTYALPNPIEAKHYDHEVRENLRTLKRYIDGNAEVIAEADTFEL